MIDFYLKFADEAEANTVLYTVTPAVYELDADGNPTDKVITESYTTPNYRNIDVLGVLFNTTDPESQVEIPGWHVNVRVLTDEDATPLEPFAIVPTQPRRVWA